MIYKENLNSERIFAMKKSLRLLTLILVFALSLSVFAGCNGNEEQTKDNEVTDDTEELDEFRPDIEKKNYGSDFFLWVSVDSNPADYYWVKESDGSAISEAVYARQEDVRKYLGVDMTMTKLAGHSTYDVPFKTAVKNQDDSVQLLVSHVHSGVDGFLSGNYLADISTLNGVDLDADYWKHDFMEDLAIEGRYFLGNNDYNILYTHCIAFNKTMMDQYADALEENMYEMVNNYHWTLDQMISLAHLVSTDATGDGKTEDDTYGLTGVQWEPFCGFLQACDIQLISLDDRGQYVVSCYTETNSKKTDDIITKLADLSKSDYAWFRYQNNDTPEIQIHTGRTLMELRRTTGLYQLCDYEDLDFGVVPYPMYDEAQKNVGYRSLQWGGYLCVPSYVNNPTMVGETLEMLAYFSDDVNITYYEKLLGKQVADAPDDRKMLDIIWDSICCDIGQTLSNVHNILYMVPILTQVEAKQSLANYMQSHTRPCNTSFRDFIKKLNIK